MAPVTELLIDSRKSMFLLLKIMSFYIKKLAYKTFQITVRQMLGNGQKRPKMGILRAKKGMF